MYLFSRRAIAARVRRQAPEALRVDTLEEFEAATAIYDPLVMRARARVGRVLREKWRLDVLLGVGGMAAVYAATHRNGSRVAIKLLHSELTVNSQVRTRFLREGYVANSVSHEGAVKIIDDDTAEDGSLFLVTELLDGETLEDRRLRLGGQLSEDEVLSAAHQLLDVLVAAHAKGVVHRDIKPENVFLTRAGQVKVLDFGIARLRELSTASTATKSGASMGTPAYMPPEQARGLWEEVDARTDLWAVGATMFCLLSGKLVHDGRTSNEMLLSAMTKPAPPLGSIAPNITPAVTHLVDRALAFERERRWPDAHRMREGVSHAYHDRFGAPLTTAPRLSIPETVPNKTLPSGAAVVVTRLPTTGQPVLRSRYGATGWPQPSRTVVAAIVFGGAAALGVGVSGVAWVVSLAHRNASPRDAASAVSTMSSTTTNPIAPPPVSLEPSSSAPPEVAATDLPGASVSAVVMPPRSPPVWKPQPPAAPTAAPAKPGCTPPFTIDPTTGKKTFRAQCL